MAALKAIKIETYHIDEVELVLIEALKSKRVTRGDKFATEQEFEWIMSDPWAWLDLVWDGMCNLYCAESIEPNHSDKTVDIVREVVCRK